MIPCEVRDCPNFGKQCWDHCNHCLEKIRWRPKGMDWGIKYTGPKPLNWDNDQKHECMRPHTKDGKWYKTQPKADAPIHPIYQGKGYTPEEVEAMKNPEIKAAWEQQRKDFLTKWEHR